MELYLFRGAEYLSSYTSYLSVPDDEIPVIVFAGRSNSGKSSLISALCGHKNLARSSATPGKTRLINYYSVPYKTDSFEKIYFVDTPGYGYANVSASEKKALRKMTDEFLLNCKLLKIMIIILDARRKLQNEEKSMILYCQENKISFLLARSKWDTLNQKEKAAAVKTWKKEEVYKFCIPCSSTDKTGLDKINELIRQSIQI